MAAAWCAALAIATMGRASWAGPIDQSGITADLTFIAQQASKTLVSLGSPASGFPVSGGETGTWSTTDASAWTSGFFPGELWLLYQATGSSSWLSAAQTWTAPLASQALQTDTHDVGFIIGTSFGNGYRLTGDPTYAATILTAATSLATRYNPTVGAVRSWSFGSWQYPVIIDNTMTLGPLQWGAANGGNPAWATMASTHATTAAANLVRSDGSTFQLADFNPTTGALIAQETYQGYSNSSTWARGQAWAIYGFTQAYQATGNPAFLATAEQTANYFLANLPADDVPYWDFNAPVTANTPRDTSAAAVAADALVTLSTLVGPSLGPSYLQDAENILGSLSQNYLAPSTGEAVLADGSDDVPANSMVDTALIFGDYYFTEGLLKLQDVLDDQPVWYLYGTDSASATPEPPPLSFLVPGLFALWLTARRDGRLLHRRARATVAAFIDSRRRSS